MTNKLSPKHMSPEDRLSEAYKLFASAILRLRDATNHPISENELDNLAQQSGAGDQFKSGGM